jgi:GTPase SAR1 family protein
MCFSVTARTSYENIRKKWINEIKQFTKDPNVLLVGTKIYLREKAERPISLRDGKELGRDTGAFAGIECSVIEGLGVNEVFETAFPSGRPAHRPSLLCV